MSFLKAEWRKLALANYVIDPTVLEPYIPAGTELDIWEGKCYISLVGFMFVNTKLLGIKVPYHVNFEEVNLRFYVKRKEGNEYKRGVVFIKEIVPKHALTFVANTVYNENYETMPMHHAWITENNTLEVTYNWQKNNLWQHFSVQTEIPAVEIPQNSETEFITEHYWGYAHLNKHASNEYEVTHPRWNAYKVINYSIEVDFGLVYGPEFSFLNDVKPASVMLAEGSPITVESKRRIKAEQVSV
ncbi:YqjF family protein [Neptunitalea lumnitzerae]|uniref:DUF2071 domain-containing protein n=1 Tax=Neptunitalea lumnitzerae TaxID=2965509 RepID=A0ABQ5MG87_9FLAO|nr:DUF2071 domain-containing protein [Neptunitalea sp. Y10]GLB47922.1 hypothetical protein Y10_02900 [Neptunitalea sp. Y10]